MAPLITLLLGSVVPRLVGWVAVDFVNNWTTAISVGLAAMFVLTGIAHFAPSMRADLVAIVPPRLPAPGLLVTITGVLELVGAAGLLHPTMRVAAALCLLALMLVMFPANVHAARMPNPPASMSTPLRSRT